MSDFEKKVEDLRERLSNGYLSQSEYEHLLQKLIETNAENERPQVASSWRDVRKISDDWGRFL